MQSTFPGAGGVLKPAGTFSRLSRTDWLYLLFLSAFSFLLCAVRSRTRLFWGDELLGHRVLSAPTVAAMLSGWWQGADGGGLFYYLLGRFWTCLFGLGELSLRLFSTTGMCVALVLTWAAARRFFSTAVVACSVTLVYYTSAVMLWQQQGNGRFYGLFLAAAAWTSLLFLIDTDQAPSHRSLFFHGLAHALLIGSHILGLVYSFSLIVGTVLFDRHKRRVRPKLYLANLSGWLLVPVSYHAIRQSASIAQAGFWTRAPGLREYLFGFLVFGKVTVLVFPVLASLAAACLVFSPPSAQERAAVVPVFYLLGSLTLAQTILFAKSRVGTSIYADRYLLPMSVGTVFLIALCLGTILRQLSKKGFFREAYVQLVSVSFVLCCCGYASLRRPNNELYPHRGYPERLVRSVPAGSTIIANSLVFELLETYDPDHRAVTPFDWKFGPRSEDHNDYSDQRLMQNWKRAGYDEANLLPCGAAFSQSANFYVLTNPLQDAWFAEHFVSNRAYRTEQVRSSAEWLSLTLWSVHRVASAAPPC